MFNPLVLELLSIFYLITEYFYCPKHEYIAQKIILGIVFTEKLRHPDRYCKNKCYIQWVIVQLRNKNLQRQI